LFLYSKSIMLKTRIILIVVSALLVIVLFLLPRVVVDNDSSITETPADSIAGKMETHAQVPDEVLGTIKNLRSKFSSDSKNEKNAIFADSLADLYAIAGKFDSSAWYAEEASKFFNSTESWIKAGDQYYQAYSFALDGSRQSQFAVRAQSFYNKVLAKNPDNLEVKTKLAMTYLTEASPMKAITTLREVLEKDPKNELALYNMGMLSIQSGQYDKAVERLKLLVEINPRHTQGNLLLGIAYMNAGDRTKARGQFEKVKLLDNDPSVQATVDSYLKDLK
jgi:outer membrane protein